MVVYVAVVAFGAWLLSHLWPKPTPALAPVRQRVLSLIDEVVPSQFGDERFAKLGFDPNKVPPGTTGCGALPGWVYSQLGDNITEWGVPGVRTNFQARKAWIEPKDMGKRRPLPGDAFITTSDPELATVMHTGLFKRIKERRSDGTEVWETADAGQAPNGAGAAFVERLYNPKDNTLTNPKGGGAVRYFGGFGDLEKALAAGPKKKLGGFELPDLLYCEREKEHAPITFSPLSLGSTRCPLCGLEGTEENAHPCDPEECGREAS